MQALVDALGRRFDVLRQPETALVFKGQAHREAVLACLYSISKRNEGIS